MDTTAETSVQPFDPHQITRPDPALMTYYFICAAFTLPAFLIVIWPLYFKYRTLKYRFDDKGVSMSWGILFHREIYLTYRRIQDIHVTRNFIHRWLGLAVVSVQTAAGSSGGEMTIEGIRNPEALRDFLYAQMRGARGAADEHTHEHATSGLTSAAAGQATASGATADEALALLREIRDDLRRIRTREGSRTS